MSSLVDEVRGVTWCRRQLLASGSIKNSGLLITIYMVLVGA